MQERSRLGILHKSNHQKGSTLSAQAKTGFLLKMGYEGMYKSRSSLMNKYDFEPVRKHLVSGYSLPFEQNQAMGEMKKQQSIPRWLQAFRLKNGRMKLEYIETVNEQLYVQFQLGRLVIKSRIA